jgi:ABC-2 type transport system permease protein
VTALTLLAADARSTWNLLRRGGGQGGRRRLALLAATPLAGGLGLGVFLGGYAVARTGTDPEPILAAGFTATVMVVLLLDLSTVITAFFADRTLVLLALAPIRTRDVFAARLVSASLPAWLVALAVLALVTGYGVGRGLGPGYYLAGLLAVAVTVAATVGLLVTALSLVLRVVPARRARDVANLLAALLGVGLYVGWFAFAGGGTARSSFRTVGRLMALGRQLEWLPTAWPGSALAAWAAGDTGGALLRFVPLLALSAALLGAAWLTYRRAFVLGLGVYGEAGATAQRRRARRAAGGAVAAGPARPVLALARKDLLTMRRDFRRLARTLPSLAIAIAYPVLFLRATVPSVGPRAAEFTFWVSMAGTLFAPFMTSVVVALPAVGLEGRGMRLLLLAGVPARTIVRAKLAVAAAIVTGLGVLGGAAGALLHGARPGQLLLLVAVLLAVSTGMAAIAVGAGAMAPEFDATDPRRAVRLEGVLVCVIVEAAFTALAAGAVASWIAAAHLAGPLVLPLAALGAGLALAAAALPVLLLVAGTRALAAWRPDA